MKREMEYTNNNLKTCLNDSFIDSPELVTIDE